MSKDEIRFAVTDKDQFRGATWKLWTKKSKRGQEIYLTCRELKGALHTSFHPSGEWHTTFSPEAHEKLRENQIEPTTSRHIESWSPKEILDGVILAYKILTPAAAVTTPLDAATRAKVTPIPNASAGRASETMVLILRPELALEMKNAMVIARLVLPDGTSVVVINHEIPMPQILQPPGSGRSTFFQGKSKTDLLAATNLRMLAFMDDANGNKMILDTRVARSDEVHE